MIRAEQERIVQESNHALLEIRVSELHYYANFYLCMMTQSILVMGFAIICLVQIDTEGVNIYVKIGFSNSELAYQYICQAVPPRPAPPLLSPI